MQSLESLIEKLIMAARWILVVFYGGLGLALIVSAASFILKFLNVASHVFDYGEEEMILAMLSLIDAALVASLLVMVMISSYENYVSRFENAVTELSARQARRRQPQDQGRVVHRRHLVDPSAADLPQPVAVH